MVYEKKVLIDQMPGLYAVGDVTLDGTLFYAAASENRGGRVCLVNSETLEVIELTGGLGGVMAVVDAKDENAMFFIEEFYPVFDSATAKVIKVEMEKAGETYRILRRTALAEVPYVHRIAQLYEEDGLYIAAGKLCKSKTEPQDWSTSGTMDIGAYDPKTDEVKFERVYDGVMKHHAMFLKKNARGYDDLYYGGTEGVFRTVRENGEWKTEHLLNVPTSDIVVYDLDGDEKDELIIIEEFHGDKAVVFKDTDKGYVRALEFPLKFGHVLWGGSFLGRPGVITGSRDGGKELILYRLLAGENNTVTVSEKTVIDEGQAPAQIMVREYGDRALILAANHGMAHMALYSCSK